MLSPHPPPPNGLSDSVKIHLIFLSHNLHKQFGVAPLKTIMMMTVFSLPTSLVSLLPNTASLKS